MGLDSSSESTPRLKAPVVQSFSGLSLNGVVISYGVETQSLLGVRAFVEETGERSSRELALTVAGENYTWTVDLSPLLGAAARQFAAAVNEAAGAAARD